VGKAYHNSREIARKISTPNICNVSCIDLDTQLEQIIMNYRSMANLNRYGRYTPFSAAAPLFLNPDRKTLLCTTDDSLAQLWVFQINEKLQQSRDGVIAELTKQSSSKEDLANRLDGMFSARCVDMSIDPFIGEKDKAIAGMHYIGVIISHYNSERNGICDAVKDCESAFLSGRSYIGTIKNAKEKGIVR
jgi:hypothetical protein